MQLTKLNIKNFRFFGQINLDFNNSLVLIESDNGSRKTSLIDALHYLGYLFLGCKGIKQYPCRWAHRPPNKKYIKNDIDRSKVKMKKYI